MALNPVAYISPGCSPQCALCVQAKPTSFAFASVQSISLYSVSTANVSVPPSADAQASVSSVHGAGSNNSVATVATYPLRSLYGHGTVGHISSFAYNDEYMACLTPQNKQVLLWKLNDSESLTAKKGLSSSLSAVFKREGNPSVMCLAGKYHILCGTNTGHVVSLNTNVADAKPFSVVIPIPKRPKASSGGEAAALATSQSAYWPLPNQPPSPTAASNAQSPVEQVECLEASAARPDLVACGTADGTLCLLSLSASTGLTAMASLCPFQPKEKEKEKSSTQLSVDPLPVTCIAFHPTSAQHLLVGSSEGALALCDTSSHSIIQAFDYSKLPEQNVSSLAWIPGDANSFYTSSTDSNVLRKWSTGSKSPVGSVSILISPSDLSDAQEAVLIPTGGEEDAAPAAPSAVGIRSVACIDASRIVVGLTNGQVKVYNVAEQKLEMSVVTGHTDALLASRVSKHDRDLAVTGGVDGMVRVWNLRTMSQAYNISVGQVMVYAVDFSPNGKHIAAALGSGEVVVYSTSTRKELWRTSVFSDLVFRVSWSSADSSLLVATSRTGVALLHTKEGKVLRRFPSPRGAFYGVDVEPSKGKTFAVGCHDHRIYVYSVTSSSERPAMVLSGHGDAVCDLAYNPTVPQYLLSGSYDGTLRIWDLSSNDSHTASVSSRVLKGHSDRVRCVAWCSIAPYLVLSGSADASIRLWDIRNGVPITTVRGHNADVIGIASHVDRPLCFLSAARDGTVVGWNLSLLRQAYLDTALGSVEQSIVADPSSLMGVATSSISVSQVAGAGITRLVQELAECASKPAERMAKIANFFEFPNGASDVAQMALYAADPAQYNATEGKAPVGLVVPASKLKDVRIARAKRMNEKAHGKTANSAGAAYRKSRLLEAAEELLRVGLLEDYCNVLVEAEEWDRAIAVAPAISRTCWRSVCVKAGEAMEAAGDARAATYYLIGEESQRAARVLARTSTGEYDAAVTVCETCPQQADAASAAEPPHNTTIDAAGASATAQALSQQRTAMLVHYANPQLLAAAMLANGQNDAAARQLQRSGDVGLSHLLVHTVPLREQASIDTAYRLSMLQSVRQHKWDTAVLCAARQSNPYDSFATLMALFQTVQAKQLAGKMPAQSLTSGNLATFNGVSERLKGFYDQVKAECAKLQLPMDAAAIQQRHASDGLASQNQLAAAVLASDHSSGPTTSSAVLQSLVGFMESLVNAAMQDPDGANCPFYLKQAYNVSAYVSLPLEVIPKGTAGASTSAIASTNMSAEHKYFLSLVYLVAALMAIKVYRFPKLLNPAFGKARDLATGADVSAMAPNLNGLVAKVQAALGTYSPHSQEVDCKTVGSMLPAISGEGKQMVSSLTTEPIVGPVHLLEDGSSFLSKGEALAWTQISHFSPLATGARLTVL